MTTHSTFNNASNANIDQLHSDPLILNNQNVKDLMDMAYLNIGKFNSTHNNRDIASNESIGNTILIFGFIKSGDDFTKAYRSELINILSSPSVSKYSSENNEIIDDYKKFLNTTYSCGFSLAIEDERNEAIIGTYYAHIDGTNLCVTLFGSPDFPDSYIPGITISNLSDDYKRSLHDSIQNALDNIDNELCYTLTNATFNIDVIDLNITKIISPKTDSIITHTSDCEDLIISVLGSSNGIQDILGLNDAKMIGKSHLIQASARIFEDNRGSIMVYDGNIIKAKVTSYVSSNLLEDFRHYDLSDDTKGGYIYGLFSDPYCKDSRKNIYLSNLFIPRGTIITPYIHTIESNKK